MTIVRVHAGGGWVTDEELTAAQINAIDINTTHALDKRTARTAATTVAVDFTQPAAGSTVTATVGTSVAMSVGHFVYVAGGGRYVVTAKPDGTHVNLRNVVDEFGNAAPGATVTATSAISLDDPADTCAGSIDAQQDWNHTGNTVRFFGSAVFSGLAGGKVVHRDASAESWVDTSSAVFHDTSSAVFVDTSSISSTSGASLAWAGPASFIRSTAGVGLTVTAFGANPGILATGGATNGSGVVGIAGGHGIGVEGIGGTTSGTGVGVQGTGGSNGAGVAGHGAGTGPGVAAVGGAGGRGVEAVGGSGGGIGVSGQGTVDQPGVFGIGGDTADAGVLGFGNQIGSAGVTGVGASNGPGVTGGGQDAASGVVGTGGNTDGTGVEGHGGGNGAGVWGHASGSGSGTRGTATGSGPAVLGQANSGPGGRFNSTSGAAIEILTGGAVFAATDIAASTDPGVDNYLDGALVCRAWVSIEALFGGTYTLADNVNVNSVVTHGLGVRVTFNRPMQNSRYVVTCQEDTTANTTIHGFVVKDRTTTKFDLYADAGTDLSMITWTCLITVQGRQT